MNTPEKIKLLQELSGLTQETLARKLRVTFAALNRWANNKAIPRKGSEQKIDALLQTYGILDSTVKPEDAKKKLLLTKKGEHSNILKLILRQKDLRDSVILALTYNSNSIEGSTFSEKDTAAVVFGNVTLSNKSMVEHLEAKNHAAALEFLFFHLQEGQPIDEVLLQRLHAKLMNAIYPDAGSYRNHAVRIVGSRTVTANPASIPTLMNSLFQDMQNPKKDMIHHVATIHARFEQIHPFSDGNGRVGRLLLAAMLLQANFPPAIISRKKKARYYSALEKAQVKNNPATLEMLIIDAVLAGYRIVERV